jgi:hypothetical protein
MGTYITTAAEYPNFIKKMLLYNHIPVEETRYEQYLRTSRPNADFSNFTKINITNMAALA